LGPKATHTGVKTETKQDPTGHPGGNPKAYPNILQGTSKWNMVPEEKLAHNRGCGFHHNQKQQNNRNKSLSHILPSFTYFPKHLALCGPPTAYILVIARVAGVQLLQEGGQL
jgi:hypothetical protein